jgi:hypothetical protein
MSAAATDMVAMGIAAIAGIDAEREGFGPLFLQGAPLCRAASCGKRLFKFFHRHISRFLST